MSNNRLKSGEAIDLINSRISSAIKIVSSNFQHLSSAADSIHSSFDSFSPIVHVRLARDRSRETIEEHFSSLTICTAASKPDEIQEIPVRFFLLRKSVLVEK